MQERPELGVGAKFFRSRCPESEHNFFWKSSDSGKVMVEQVNFWEKRGRKCIFWRKSSKNAHYFSSSMFFPSRIHGGRAESSLWTTKRPINTKYRKVQMTNHRIILFLIIKPWSVKSVKFFTKLWLWKIFENFLIFWKV